MFLHVVSYAYIIYNIKKVNTLNIYPLFVWYIKNKSYLCNVFITQRKKSINLKF